ncbi:MAG TPA: tetratricopeptide repeat protein [Kofleriaceae bacterium]
MVARKTNVVDAAFPLIGRETELTAIGGFFDEGLRLVTLLGPGGAGKTRLATAFAASQIDAYSEHGGGGVWFCDLVPARGTSDMCAIVANALGITIEKAPIVNHGDHGVVAIGRALARRRRMLIVVDNCEHISAIAAAMLSDWMQAAPHLHVLVTSRVPLRLADEQLYPLAGLALESAAVELFMRRAQQVRPDLAIDAPAIAEIVKRLDGQPLAIELAAARTRLLTIPQLLDRLALDLLARPGDGRHASLRAVILDSIASLDEETRDVFVRCAVFRGGFDLAAAEAILGKTVALDGGPYRTGGGGALRGLETLVENSLLRVDGARFRIYETILEVARELFDKRSDRDELREAHARYYAQLPEAVCVRELDNLLAALAATSEASPDVRNDTLELALALAIDPILAMRGNTQQRITLLDTVIGAGRDPRYAPALVARGHAYRELGDFDAAELDLIAGQSFARMNRDNALRARAELALGELVEIEGRTVDARDYYLRALSFVEATASPDAAIRANAHAHLAHAHRREGNLAATETHLTAASALYRAIGDREGEARMLYESAVVALFRQEFDAVRRRLEDGLALAQALEARQLEAAFTSGLGVLLQETGELDAAIAHHTRAVQAFRDLGNRHREGSALYYLGCSYLERNELVEALAVFEQAAVVIAAVGAHRYAALIDSARGAASALAFKEQPSVALSAFANADLAAALCESERALAATLAIHRLHVSSLPAATRLDTARELVASATGDDPRFAMRVLTHALTAAVPRRAPTAWNVRSDGSQFRAPGAQDVDLSKRHPLRRIVAALAHQRVTAPGDTLGFDELLAAGWPDERIAQAAALNRLHVALTTLRKLGLRDLLLSGERGYMFDPAIPVEVSGI